MRPGQPGGPPLSPVGPTGMPMRGGYDPGYDLPAGGQPQGQAQQANFAQLFPLPVGEFDPRTTALGGVAGAAGATAPMTSVVGWAHDAKPEPGKTYRYAIRYKIKNPIWATRGEAKPQTLADQFALVSADSGWTPPVSVKSIVTFYFASGGGFGRTEAQVDVYRWQDGLTHKKRFRIGPGDAIGLEAEGVDYSTGYTLVDLRNDARDRPIAWLLGPDGIMIKRDVRIDMESPQHREMDSQSSAAAATAAAGPGGTPAMINAVGTRGDTP